MDTLYCSTPRKLTEENFAPYGQYLSMYEGQIKRHGQQVLHFADGLPIDQPMKMGMVMIENEPRFLVKRMERHLTTPEVIFSAGEPIVLSLADSDPLGQPKAEDVVSFILNQGDLVVINAGIWHDACHSCGGSAKYYYFAHGTGTADEITWHSLHQGPVLVDSETHTSSSGRVGQRLSLVEADEENFEPFGRYHYFKDFELFEGDGWKSWMTENVCMEQPAQIGTAISTVELPAYVTKMWKYSKTHRLVCGADKPLAFVATDGNHDGELRAFVIKPASFVVIAPGIWHSTFYSIGEGLTHYFVCSLEGEEVPKSRDMLDDLVVIEPTT